MKYKVLEKFVSKHGAKVYVKGDIFEVATCGDSISALLQNDFIQPIQEHDFANWEKTGKRSKLAKVIIAPEDYAEGDKKFFTWEEACAIKNKLNNGWRLPSRSEWALICEEFGQKDGHLDVGTLEKTLALRRHGYLDDEGSLRNAGSAGSYWSATAYPVASALYAFNLGFSSAGVFPSDYVFRWYGFTVRLVKGVEE